VSAGGAIGFPMAMGIQ
jgi:hypothetical protein